MSKRKIYCINGSTGYANWMEGEIVDTMEEADLVVAEGGSDVPYQHYAKKGHPATWGYSRGDHEYNALKKAISLDKRIWGTCKGLI